MLLYKVYVKGAIPPEIIVASKLPGVLALQTMFVTAILASKKTGSTRTIVPVASQPLLSLTI
ncbi:hypothetical protein D3C85_879080 [compost metagenome]